MFPHACGTNFCIGQSSAPEEAFTPYTMQTVPLKNNPATENEHELMNLDNISSLNHFPHQPENIIYSTPRTPDLKLPSDNSTLHHTASAVHNTSEQYMSLPEFSFDLSVSSQIQPLTCSIKQPKFHTSSNAIGKLQTNVPYCEENKSMTAIKKFSESSQKRSMPLPEQSQYFSSLNNIQTASIQDTTVGYVGDSMSNSQYIAYSKYNPGGYCDTPLQVFQSSLNKPFDFCPSVPDIKQSGVFTHFSSDANLPSQSTKDIEGRAVHATFEESFESPYIVPMSGHQQPVSSVEAICNENNMLNLSAGVSSDFKTNSQTFDCKRQFQVEESSHVMEQPDNNPHVKIAETGIHSASSSALLGHTSTDLELKGQSAFTLSAYDMFYSKGHENSKNDILKVNWSVPFKLDIEKDSNNAGDPQMSSFNEDYRLCRICNQWFCPKRNIRPTELLGDKIAFICEICYSEFSCSDELRNHMRTHRQSHICENCHQTFARMRERLPYMPAPINEKKYFCDKCGKIFNSKYTKTKHQKVCNEKKEI